MRYPLLCFCAVLLFCACNRTNNTTYILEQGSRFHTYYHITYKSNRSLSDAIDSTMSAFNASLNPFDSTTLISRINRNETDSLDHMLYEVIQTALKVSEATNGMYDITGAPLFDLWGFGTKKGVTRYASQQEVDSIKTFVGYQYLQVDSGRLQKKDPRMRLNPSSLSKGYVTDLVAQTLENHGIQDYMVEIGGEIVCSGKNPLGECWQIGVNKPIENNKSAINVVAYKVPICSKRGLATSGDYRNYKDLPDGRRVAHTINLKTGYPSHQNILSATVIAPTCMQADAWATAFMSLGMDATKRLLEQHPELNVLLVYTTPNGEVHTYTHGVAYKEIE